MLIAVSVLIAKIIARDNFGAPRQESTPPLVIAYSYEHYAQLK